jgi:hypothetical protein
MHTLHHICILVLLAMRAVLDLGGNQPVCDDVKGREPVAGLK